MNKSEYIQRIFSLPVALTIAGLLIVAPVLFALAQTTISSRVAITGNAYVVGAMSKGSGSFVIDHPLDPENKLLYHSFVESPDVKNIYDGVVKLNRKGEAVIRLPDYFLALNSDFRYLATSLDGPMPNLHLAEEVYTEPTFFGRGERILFKIAGGESGGKVSWQVSGIRKDPLIIARPIVPETEKGPGQVVNVGECIFEPLCR